MTRKDFNKIADILHEEYVAAGPNSEHVVRAIIFRMAALCAETNERFDYERFYRACGLTIKEGMTL